MKFRRLWFYKPNLSELEPSFYGRVNDRILDF